MNKKVIDKIFKDDDFKNLFIRRDMINLWNKNNINKKYWENLYNFFGIKSLPCLEIYRFLLIKKLEKKAKIKFKLDNSFSLIYLLLNENNHKKDPILSKITSNNTLKNTGLRIYLNSEIPLSKDTSNLFQAILRSESIELSLLSSKPKKIELG